MKEILTTKRKVQIKGLYSSEELERTKADLKKRGLRSTKSQISPKSLKVQLPLNISIISDTSKSSGVSPIKKLDEASLIKEAIVFENSQTTKLAQNEKDRLEDDTSTSSVFTSTESKEKKIDEAKLIKKSIVLKNPQTKSAQDEDVRLKDDTSSSRENYREEFRNSFILEIRKIEVNMLSKFENLNDSKNKQLQEEKEKCSNLLNTNSDLKKENEKINQSMENLKKLIIPMKQKLEEHKKHKENFANVEKGLREEIGKLQIFNETLTEKVASFQGVKASEEVSVLRKELAVQNKRVEDIDKEKDKLAKEINSKEQSLKLVHSQCFSLKEEMYKLKKDQAFIQEKRVMQMNKMKEELAEVQKTYKHSKSNHEKYKMDKEAAEKIILEKEQEIKELKEALEETKKNQASSSKRKQQNGNSSDKKIKRTEQPINDSDIRQLLNVSHDNLEPSNSTSESQLKDKEPAQNSLLAVIDNFNAFLSSSRISQTKPSASNVLDKEDDVDKLKQVNAKDAIEKDSQEKESSLESPCYSPAKTSNVAKTTSLSKPKIKIRDVNELLQDFSKKQEIKSSLKRIDLEKLDDKEDANSALSHKKYLDKDVKAAVARVMNRFLHNKTISSEEESRDLVNVFVPDFTERIITAYLQTNPTEKGINVTSIDKQYIIDQIILYFSLSDSIHKYISPFELKICLQLKLNQKSFGALKEGLVNKLFTSVREVSQEAVIAKFDRRDQYYSLGHVITNPEKNKISNLWLTKRFVDHALGSRGFNVSTPVVSM